MDWKRVKGILIIALLVVNAFLAYTLYQDRERVETEALDRSLIINLLTKHDIQLDESLMDTGTDLPNISLKLQNYDLVTLQEAFTPYSSYENDHILQAQTYINQNKQLVYMTTSVDEYLDTHTLSEDQAIQQAYALIESLGFPTSDVYLKSTGQTGKKMIINFGQMINGHQLIDSHMTVKYNNKNLLEFDRVWYDILRVYDIETADYSAEYALYDFVGQVSDKLPNRERSLTIENIQLVYKLSLKDDINQLNDFNLEGDARIHWKITTSDQKSYLVKAMID